MAKMVLTLENGYTVTVNDGAPVLSDGKSTLGMPIGTASRALVIESLQMASSFYERMERSKEAVVKELDEGTGTAQK